ncbi:unnamed protein product [Notodromas monacha]|uniref:Uncharacterized protein n=1 Tax=Notodromas monacha TaxID=399045 RepID=A0A7R9GGG2_9CRUS|nr:unnamed protein product [Notodromas monacha]CAG0919916.1 unnamed protein product [Notodromas monacha]
MSRSVKARGAIRIPRKSRHFRDYEVENLYENAIELQLRHAEAIRGKGSLASVTQAVRLLTERIDRKLEELWGENPNCTGFAHDMERPARIGSWYSIASPLGSQRSSELIAPRRSTRSTSGSLRSTLRSNSSTRTDDSTIRGRSKSRDSASVPSQRSLSDKENLVSGDSLKGYVPRSKYLRKLLKEKSDFLDQADSASDDALSRTTRSRINDAVISSDATCISSSSVNRRVLSESAGNSDLCDGSEAWFQRLKEFRERNKATCVASKPMIPGLDQPHKCVHYYRLNKRLVSSPVWRDSSGRSVCPEYHEPDVGQLKRNSYIIPDEVAKKCDVFLKTPPKKAECIVCLHLSHLWTMLFKHALNFGHGFLIVHGDLDQCVLIMYTSPRPSAVPVVEKYFTTDVCGTKRTPSKPFVGMSEEEEKAPNIPSTPKTTVDSDPKPEPSAVDKVTESENALPDNPPDVDASSEPINPTMGSSSSGIPAAAGVAKPVDVRDSPDDQPNSDARSVSKTHRGRGRGRGILAYRKPEPRPGFLPDPNSELFERSRDENARKSQNFGNHSNRFWDGKRSVHRNLHFGKETTDDDRNKKYIAEDSIYYPKRNVATDQRGSHVTRNEEYRKCEVDDLTPKFDSTSKGQHTLQYTDPAADNTSQGHGPRSSHYGKKKIWWKTKNRSDDVERGRSELRNEEIPSQKKESLQATTDPRINQEQKARDENREKVSYQRRYAKRSESDHESSETRHTRQPRRYQKNKPKPKFDDDVYNVLITLEKTDEDWNKSVKLEKLSIDDARKLKSEDAETNAPAKKE